MRVCSKMRRAVLGLPESLVLSGKLGALTLWEGFGYVDVARRAKKSKTATLARCVKLHYRSPSFLS